MSSRIPAIYEHGVFKPKEAVQLEEGAAVELVILRPPVAKTTLENGAEQEGPRAPAEILARIAALPEEDDGEPFSGADHDNILYGPEGAR